MTSRSPSPPVSGPVILSDVMGSNRTISLFTSSAREVDPVAKRLDDPKISTTVLAPLNSAISDLPHKPWENPSDYTALGANAYEGPDGRAKAKENLRRFVEAHLVPVAPWVEGDRVKTLEGTEVWWEEKDGKKTIQPDGIEVATISNKVANGEVWIIQGVRRFT
ncbi:FAS1 domain-containing protein NCU02579 [Ceratocystis fimbriata CBS 114723]|uniref:FAS1 domain-containing protein NCU02579 n=1 Tax=Ceratocystis fimbriata CBS 114723 TaxID=1035309 RepID=A0A2C5XHV7_9PEZI|nr:FAS1 domain-containing protein NCU02579 [Ceratocystis fimbriata CBS 114723]